ncbi:MAG: YfhO family protein [Ruminococcus flavefaciens]|nr:YfhO family protein [Ruminococcus flavefaciens]
MDYMKLWPGGKGGVRHTCRDKIKSYFLAYTLCFLAACLIVFCWFFMDGRTLIFEVDGWQQHYTALVYYGQYLRDAFGSLLSGKGFTAPGWGFDFGEGNSVLGTLHYYGIGDPLAALSVFVPEAYMYLFYNAMVILRLYLAGVAFSFLCFQTGDMGRYAVLAGAMSYVFCYWGMLCAARHPFFLNPMIYLPMLVLGAEKVIRGGRPYLFTVSVCLSALSNFYFFYILVVLMVVYVAARLITRYRTDIAAIARMVLRVGIYSVLGVMMAAVILLPVLYVFLSDARMSAGGVWPLLYPKHYYSLLPGLFLQEGAIRWMCMGYPVPVFLAACMLVPKRRQHGFLLLLFAIGAAFIAFPALGKILSAFSYIGNRWSFAFALLASYILAAMWPSLTALGWKEWLYLAFCTAAYLLLCLRLGTFGNGRFPYLAALLVALLLLLAPLAKGGRLFAPARWKQAAMFACVLVSIGCNAYWKYAKDDYRSECLKAEKVSQGYPRNGTKAVKKAIKADKYDGFARYSGRRLVRNAGAVAGLPSTDYYWSVSNPAIARYRKGLAMLEYNLYKYSGYDDRAALLSLSSVRYFITPYKDGAPPPYGFTYLDTYRVKGDARYKVYRNDYMLPLAYAYDSYLTEEACSHMTGLERQQAMLQAVILEEKLEGFQEAALRLDSVDIPYKVSCSGGVSMDGNSIKVTSPGASVTLSFQGEADSETYVSFTGLDFDNLPLYTEQAVIGLESSNGRSKKLYYYNPASARMYNGRHDFTVNMGYSKDAGSSVTLRFQDIGNYSFDSLKITCQPMGRYASQVKALQQGIMGEWSVGADKVSGTVSLDRPKLLCLSIPFDAGWRAYVDGSPARLYQANTKNMALALDAGEHTIELRYETPMLKAGAAVSAFGFLLFAALVFIREKKYTRKGVGL